MDSDDSVRNLGAFTLTRPLITKVGSVYVRGSVVGLHGRFSVAGSGHLSLRHQGREWVGGGRGPPRILFSGFYTFDAAVSCRLHSERNNLFYVLDSTPDTKDRSEGGVWISCGTSILYVTAYCTSVPPRAAVSDTRAVRAELRGNPVRSQQLLGAPVLRGGGGGTGRWRGRGDHGRH